MLYVHVAIQFHEKNREKSECLDTYRSYCQCLVNGYRNQTTNSFHHNTNVRTLSEHAQLDSDNLVPLLD